VFTLLLITTAIAAGVAMVPGERERWTMLVRDNRNEEALDVLKASYHAGQSDPDAVLQLYKLLMSFAEIAQATQVIEQFVADRPGDVEAITLLAKHYGDTQNVHGEERARRRLFELSPSQGTAQRLLSIHRLTGAFDQEERLLRSLLARQIIAANDAERLGLLLFARGDLDGARQALTYFDEIANPERMIGRLALFDLLVHLGDTQTALVKVAAWIPNWRKGSIHPPGGPEVSLARLVRMMMAVDAVVARRILCATPQDGSSLAAIGRSQDLACPAPAGDFPAGELVAVSARQAEIRSGEVQR
jgi:tetratricopeptide (TPR) repeat protein